MNTTQTKLVRPTPFIHWDIVITQPPRTVQAIYRYSPAYYTIKWGDGTQSVGGPQRPAVHRYPQAGLYMLAIILEGTTEAAAYAQVHVRDEVYPQVSFHPENPSTRPDLIHLQIDEPSDGPISRYEVDWGDGSPKEQFVGIPGTRPAQHTYQPGTYQAKVRDLSTKVLLFHDVDVPAVTYDPDFTITAHAGSPLQADAEVTKVDPAKQLRIDWGDGTQDHVDTEVGAEASHLYAAAGTYLVQLFYIGGPMATTKPFQASGGGA